MLFSACWAVRRDPRRLRVRPQPPRLGVLRPVALLHAARPDAARRPELGDLLEEVVVHVEEEREPGRERIDVEAGRDRALHVLETVAKGEGQLLRGRGARFADVVTRDRDRVVARGVVGAPVEHVDDAAQRGLRWEDPRVLCLVLLQDVVLDRPSENLGRDPLLLRRGHVEAEQDDRRPVDRHRDRHLVQRDAVEEPLHVGQRRDGHPTHAHLTERSGMVGVVAHQRREVERDREAGLALRQQILVALVGLGCGGEPGELAHGPEPRPIHGGVRTARERVLARQAERVLIAVGLRPVEGRVEGLHLLAGDRREERVALGDGSVRLLPLREALLQLLDLRLPLTDETLQIAGPGKMFLDRRHASLLNSRPHRGATGT